MGETSENLRNSWACLWMFSLRYVMSWLSILRHILDANDSVTTDHRTTGTSWYSSALARFQAFSFDLRLEAFASYLGCRKTKYIHAWMPFRPNGIAVCFLDVRTNLPSGLLLVPFENYSHMKWFRRAALEHTRSTIPSDSDFVAHVSEQSKYLCQESTSWSDLPAVCKRDLEWWKCAIWGLVFPILYLLFFLDLLCVRFQSTVGNLYFLAYPSAAQNIKEIIHWPSCQEFWTAMQRQTAHIIHTIFQNYRW